MRDRLIELMKQADEYTLRRLITDNKEATAAIADYLIENGVIVLPCKVGDTVYRISKRYGKWCVLPRTVCSITYSLDSRGNIAWYLFTTTEDRIGKTVFLTCEEAEQALLKP